MADSKTKLEITSIPHDLLRSLARQFFDRYRPELHYMRGPGPKWREAHPQPTATTIVFGPDAR